MKDIEQENNIDSILCKLESCISDIKDNLYKKRVNYMGEAGEYLMEMLLDEGDKAKGIRYE